MKSTISLQFLNAVRKGNLSSMKRLHRSNSTELDELGGQALRLAGDEGYTDICLYLVSRGVPIDTISKGHTALMSAAMMGRSQTCLRLLESGADSLQIRSDGLGVVAIARASGREETAALLMAWQAKEAARLAIAELTNKGAQSAPGNL